MVVTTKTTTTMKMNTLTDARLVVGWEDESTSCITLSNDCLDHRCLNGATCVDDVRTYTCLCPPGYTGNVVIVMLVVVSSASSLFAASAAT